MTVKLATCNSRGGDSKVPFILDVINKNQLDILFLQEIHAIQLHHVNKIENDSKMKCFISPGTQRGRGVMTIINPNVVKNASLYAHDNIGNSVTVYGEILGKPYYFMNIYAPNDEAGRRVLFENMIDFIRNEKSTFFGGDFNCIEDINLDSINKSQVNFMRRKTDREKLRALKDDCGFVDTFRELHKTKIQFTYTSPTNYRARLDRIYIHRTMTSSLAAVSIIPTSFSDHDLYIVEYQSSDDRIKWGPGNYKYNKKLLENKENLNEVKQAWLEWRKHRHKYQTILEWWDAGKRMLVRNILIPMSKRIKQKQCTEMDNLRKQLREEHAKTANNANRILDLKQRLTTLEEAEMAGAAIRSKAEWQEKGEKPTKFFFGLEKQRGKEKQIYQLKNDNGDLLENKEDILKYTKDYYERKFTAEPTDSRSMEMLINSLENRLTDEQNSHLNQPFTMKELNCVKTKLSNGKSPGNDGLSCEFYKQTWHFIVQDLLDVFNYIFLSGELPLSMTQALVTLIYKNKGDRLELRNWRPISLLCVDYKILTSMISHRLEPVLPLLIHPDQACAVKGRFIEDHLICIQDIVDYAAQFPSKSMICALDLEAAYDRADHFYLNKLLHHLNFGHRLETLMKVIFSNMYMAISINGARTGFLKQSRSIRQGDPAAMSIFILSVEPLANIIRRDNQLSPIRMPNQQPRAMIQYCDDATFFSESSDDLQKLKVHTDLFEKGSGAKFNQQKTEILLLGRWTQNEKDKLPQECIKESVKILGVWFGHRAAELNQERILEKIDKITEAWKDIPLSIQGKKLIINLKILSQLYHVVRVTGMTQNLQKEVQKRIIKFFWAPKKMNLVSYRTLQNSIEKGGQMLPNLDEINKAILAERISKILNTEKQWKGHFIFRLGFSLRKLDFNFASPLHRHTFQQTAVTATIAAVYRDLDNEVTDWKTETFKTLKSRLHEDAPIRPLRPRDYSETWITINETATNRKARDLSYLIAHESLPIADILVRRGLNIEDKCGLCGANGETLEHLFITCPMVRELKREMEARMNWLGGRTLSEEEIIFHEGIVKMRKKDRTLISLYKHTIWIIRALKYYGQIHDGQDIRNKLLHMYRSKIQRN